jgi:hypothetical protein
MKTPNLDHEIERLTLLERTNDLSEYGKELITEYKAIKQALSLHNVSKCECGETKDLITVCEDCTYKMVSEGN